MNNGETVKMVVSFKENGKIIPVIASALNYTRIQIAKLPLLALFIKTNRHA